MQNNLRPILALVMLAIISIIPYLSNSSGLSVFPHDFSESQTAQAGNVPATPSITSVSVPGCQVDKACRIEIKGTNFTTAHNDVKIGDVSLGINDGSFGDLQLNTYSNSIVADIKAGIPQGSYLMTVTNSNGTSVGVPFSITSPPTIISISPESGPEGTEVTITGTGFSSSNDIEFGNVGLNAPSTDGGTVIKFIVPSMHRSYYGSAVKVYVISDSGETDPDRVPSFTVEQPTTVADALPPVITITSPSGEIPSTATNVTLSVSTNEDATCRYSTTARTSFADMASRQFQVTGGRTHTLQLSNLARGTSYVYFVRCKDVNNNVNQNDTRIGFSISAVSSQADTTRPVVSWQAPYDGTVINNTDQISLSATAYDQNGIAGVTIYLDDVAIGPEDTTSPYKTTLTIRNGVHTARAVARDVANNISQTDDVTFSVNFIDPNMPDDSPQIPQYYDPLISPIVYTEMNNVEPKVAPSSPVQTPTAPVVTRTPANSRPKKTSVISPVKNFTPTILTRKVKIGDTGREVFVLQRTLNLLKYSIATSGPQSLGRETSRFDEATKSALMRYQDTFSESGVVASGALDNATLTLLNRDIQRLVADAESISANNNENNNPNLEEKDAKSSSTIGTLLEMIKGLFK